MMVDAVKKLSVTAWAAINDRERAIAHDCVGASESQATKTFIAGWPEGWPQAKAAGWRMSRVTIIADTQAADDQSID